MTSQGEKTVIVAAEVADLNDPEQLGRVRVRYPHLGNQISDWARTVALGNGSDRGSHVIPEVGDEVLVAHEHGDPRRPYILGGLWNKEDQPPVGDGQPTQNNWRFSKSRSGHIFRFDDTQGGEKIEIIDKSGGNVITIDTVQNTITISATQSVVVQAQSVQIESTNIEINGNASISLTAPSVDVSASGSLSLESGGAVTIRGAVVNIN